METQPKLRYGVDAYEDWVEHEGLRVHEGWALDLFEAETQFWPRYDVKGAVAHLRGRGDWCNMFVLDIPAGRATAPQRHLYEEVYYVLEGRGSTQLEFADGRKRSFEWGRHSLFAIPLNAKHRHFNGSGTHRALLCTTTLLPMMLKVLTNERFVFGNDFAFDDRIGKDEYFGGEGDLERGVPGKNIWQTNFIPDVAQLELFGWSDRGQGSSHIGLIMADGIMHAHISEIAPATYKKAHYHEGGRHVMTVTGKGYSLLWFEGDADFTRVDWHHGVVFPPMNRQFHQHFVTSNEPSRYLATGMGGYKHPVTAETRRINFGEPGKKKANSLSTKEGGTQVEYEDQDPRIHALWLEELRGTGVTPRFELPLRT